MHVLGILLNGQLKVFDCMIAYRHTRKGSAKYCFRLILL